VNPWCRHFQKGDWQDHVCDAKYAIIQDYPTKKDIENGIPFSGFVGYDLEKWQKEAGILRSECFFTSFSSDLYMSLRSTLPLLSVVVPTGDNTLRGLFGSKMSVSDWRGSILSWNGIWCIPTLHPSVTQRQKILTKLCVADWKRIAYVGKWGHTPMIRKHIVDPSMEEMIIWKESAMDYFENSETQLPPRVLSVDVENDIKTKKLLCVGFSFDPKVSLTISTVQSDYDDEGTFQAAQQVIKDILSFPWPVVGQNYMTDVWKLVHWAPEIKHQLIDNYVWDLIEMDHALDPNDGGDTSAGAEDEMDVGLKIGMRDLGTLASLYTKEPYYKHEGGSWDQEKRWIYNGKDACVQREIFDVLWWKLYERGLV
jgi:hypothetical protein